MADRSALVVASDHYADPRLRKLRAPAIDAEHLVRVLGDPQIGSFEVEVLLNEPEHAVRRRLASFFSDRVRDDLLFVHFSCHGVKDDDGQLYFATADTEMDNLDATAVSAEFVNRQMARSRSHRIALFLDCCYSGAFSRAALARAGDQVDLADRFEGRGQVVITASTAMEYAFEGEELTGHGTPSVFTSALVEGLETGAADLDGDSLISVDELYDYLYDSVRGQSPGQTPSKWVYDLRGELYLARAPASAQRPADLPAELQDAVGSAFVSAREHAVVELERLLRGRHRGLALAAEQALEQLAEDDSRKVSSAARHALENREPEEPEQTEAADVSDHPQPEEAPPVEAEPASVAEAPVSDEVADEAQREPEPVVEAPVGAVSAVAPTPPELQEMPAPAPAAPAAIPARRSRALPVAIIALVGAGVALVANAFSHIQGQPAIGTLAAYTPETIGVPVLTAGVALLLAFGRIREQFAYGLLLGFGLLTLTGGIGMAVIQSEFHLQLGGAPFVFLAGGAVILSAALVGILDNAQVHVRPGGHFRSGSASILAAAGAAILVPALFVPLGRLAEDGSDVSLSQYGHYGFSGSALEPAVAIAAALVAAYALGCGGARRLLAAGVALALGLQTVLMLGTWLGSVITEYYVKPELRAGWLVGIAAAALLVAAGLVGRRSSEDQAEKSAGAVASS